MNGRNIFGRIMKLSVICTVVLLSFALLFSGCRLNPLTKAELAEGMQGGFALKADVLYEDMEISAIVKRTAEKKYQISVDSPAHLRGVEVEYENGELNVSYLGFNIKVDENSFPASSMLKSIITSLESGIFGDTSTLEKKDAVYEINGSCEAGAYRLVLNGENYFPVELEIPEINLKCMFTADSESNLQSSQ